MSGITFRGFPASGSYQTVNSLTYSGSCTFGPSAYTSNVAPLNEELTAFFRGPLKLAQFAVYTPGSTNWAQTAYYNAAAKTATGLTFLANNNYITYATIGSKPGYVAADGQSTSSTSAVLSNVELPDRLMREVSAA
ncbi:target of Sbf [Ptychographa xylographoides]|nr:target of Sbf [Ptychographa xylographoides]